MRPLNILYKSTTNVSIGDDIALIGTRNLFRDILPGHNSFLYSRRDKDCWKAELGMRVDLVVIAGTPIWSGKEMSALEEFIIEKKKPVFYCGVGMNYGDNIRTSKALARSIGFIARDNYAYKRVNKETDARLLSCPSIFSVERLKETGDKIGIVPQFDTQLKEQLAFLKGFERKDVVIICNEIVDYVWAEKHLPDYETLYSRWLPEMVENYSRCKEIYSMRIHGAHLAYALGIKTVCMKTGKDKSVTCKQIGLELIRPSKVKASHLKNDIGLRQTLYSGFVEYITKKMTKHFPDYVR